MAPDSVPHFLAMEIPEAWTAVPADEYP